MSIATTGATAPARWPRQRLLVALLAISVVLNLLFVAGALWTRLHPFSDVPAWQRPYRHIATQLDLNAEQQSSFEQYVRDMHARSMRMRQQIAPLISGAWDEIAQPQANQAQIMQRFDDASRKWREFQQDSTLQTLQFLSVLSPAQRSKFVALVKERRAERFRPHQ